MFADMERFTYREYSRMCPGPESECMNPDTFVFESQTLTVFCDEFYNDWSWRMFVPVHCGWAIVTPTMAFPAPEAAYEHAELVRHYLDALEDGAPEDAYMESTFEVIE